MRACYFWYGSWPAAVSLLGRHAPDAERIWTGPDDGGYWRALAARWASPGDLLVIEQDVGLHAGVIPQLAACPQPWCAFRCPGQSDQVHDAGLGCTRFREEMRRDLPAAAIAAARSRGCPSCEREPCWRHIDGAVLAAAGAWPHLHLPPVAHFHYRPGG